MITPPARIGEYAGPVSKPKGRKPAKRKPVKQPTARPVTARGLINR